MLITEARMYNRGKAMSIQSVWLLQAGLIQALAKVLKQGGMGSQVREGLSEALKHLTASSQKNRDTLVASQALPIIIAHLRTGHPHASLMSAHYTPALPCLPLMHSNKQQLCILCTWIEVCIALNLYTAAYKWPMLLRLSCSIYGFCFCGNCAHKSPLTLPIIICQAWSVHSYTV